MEGRTILIIVIMTLCVLDLVLTYHYVWKYKQWQPNKPYKLIELNPLLRFVWNKLGFHFGMFVAGVLIIGLNYFVARYAHWSVVFILLAFLIFAMYNHAHNTILLYKLIEQYPSGYLPVETFGYVPGNNPK